MPLFCLHKLWDGLYLWCEFRAGLLGLSISHILTRFIRAKKSHLAGWLKSTFQNSD